MVRPNSDDGSTSCHASLLRDLTNLMLSSLTWVFLRLRPRRRLANFRARARAFASGSKRQGITATDNIYRRSRIAKRKNVPERAIKAYSSVKNLLEYPISNRQCPIMKLKSIKQGKNVVPSLGSQVMGHEPLAISAVSRRPCH